MRKIAVSLLTLLLSALALCAANIEKPVTWSVSIENKTADGGTLLIKGDIKEGWHIYGIEMPELRKDAGVPDPTRIEFTSGAQPD
ncbi:MAG: hypothetical protein K2K22_06095, partial [Muribaculaceae bacterium]|nr:hypothetical protein [Muribaculaceae bacterium]